MDGTMRALDPGILDGPAPRRLACVTRPRQRRSQFFRIGPARWSVSLPPPPAHPDVPREEGPPAPPLLRPQRLNVRQTRTHIDPNTTTVRLPCVAPDSH